MILNLLLVGLAVTPFILAPGEADLARAPKMAWAVCFALAISLMSLYKGKLEPFKNKWALVLIGFSLLSFYLSPRPDLKLFGVPSGRFWSWEPLYQGLVFLLFTVSVASIKLDRQKLNWILDVMVWCAGLMSVFVIFQFLYLDQFFEHRFGTYGRVAGTIGNPTLVGPFLCLVIPLMLYRRQWIFFMCAVVATIITRSDVALAGLIITLVMYLILKTRKLLFCGLGLMAVIVPLIIGIYLTNPTFRQYCPDNERFITWRNSLKTLKVPVMKNSKKIYAMTGIGPGSFKYLYHTQHEQGKHETFAYAHNDYVQTAYETGVVGFILFLGTIFFIFKLTYPGEARRALTASLIGILVCAGGSFVLQIGTHIFYALTIVGLLLNPTRNLEATNA